MRATLPTVAGDVTTGWGYWQFDGDFIVYDMKNQNWVEPIQDALIPASPEAG